MRTKTINGKTWVIDARNNRASIERWGSEENARAALESCSYCSDCWNCSDCSGCSGCSDCSGCSGCSRCWDCSDCSYCSGCSNCSYCSNCSNCSYKNELADNQWVIPVVADIHRKIYDAASQPGSLKMSAWHTCETTHCRAGWAIHLAGEAGYELEKKTSPVFAAMQIYKASGYRISPVRFFEPNEVAMEDMKRLAEAGQ
jgi:hypothetical protein